jgi:hypothetical protein
MFVVIEADAENGRGIQRGQAFHDRGLTLCRPEPAEELALQEADPARGVLLTETEAVVLIKKSNDAHIAAPY